MKIYSNKVGENIICLPFFLVIFFFFSLGLKAQPNCLGEQGQLKWLQWKTYDSIDEMTHSPDFPYAPNHIEYLSDFTTGTTTFGQEYTSLVRGYLKVPQTGNYTFNVTGKDRTIFSLSTDDSEFNLSKIGEVPSGTEPNEYNKFPEQTSEVISLNANNYYYFELLHTENFSEDHFRISWKTPIMPSDTFKTITSEFLYDYICYQDCAEKGTTCDDGDPSTTNDIEDGYCNCFGTPQPENIPICIGGKGFVNVLYFDTIPGTRLTDLYFSPKYPLSPDRGSQINTLATYDTEIDDYGTLIKGYLTVPQTGIYHFNITGVRRSLFKLSPSEDPNQAVSIAYFDLTSFITRYEHDTEPTQTSQPQTLVKGKYYYFEIHHKASNNYDRVNIFWKTPYYNDDHWRNIEDSYLYQFDPDCDLACLPLGTPCDDGSSLTINDAINSDCNCVGIPCPNNDCNDTPLPYTPPPTCGISDELKSDSNTSWLSCQNDPNPNSSRPDGHWIQYDLGNTYYVDKAHIWNYNVNGQTGKGFKEVAIDYSLDGSTWETLGNFDWSEASGTKGYSGFDEPSFGVYARFVLFTALDNFDGGACSGISKANFTTYNCSDVGKSCNDQNSHTVNDTFDKFCNCVGETKVENYCSKENRIQENIPIESGNYDARREIETKAIINADYDVSYVAGISISFLPDFHAKEGSELIAYVEPCPLLLDNDLLGKESADSVQSRIQPYEVNFTTEEQVSVVKELRVVDSKETSKTTLIISPNPTNNWSKFEFNLPRASVISITIFSTSGQEVFSLINGESYEAGKNYKIFPTQQLTKGIYFINLKTEDAIITENLVVIE